MPLLDATGTPIGGPEQSKAVIGGTEVSFFVDPRVGLTFGAMTPGQVGQMLSSLNAYVNALCREIVVLRERLEVLEPSEPDATAS